MVEKSVIDSKSRDTMGKVSLDPIMISGPKTPAEKPLDFRFRKDAEGKIVSVVPDRDLIVTAANGRDAQGEGVREIVLARAGVEVTEADDATLRRHGWSFDQVVEWSGSAK